MRAEPSDRGSDQAGAPGWDPTTRTGRMHSALDSVLAIGPGFLNGDVDADTMANTMVRVAREHIETDGPLNGDATGTGEAQELYAALAELLTCGSGYLAGRCDADCVVRTMTQMVSEFGAKAS